MAAPLRVFAIVANVRILMKIDLDCPICYSNVPSHKDGNSTCTHCHTEFYISSEDDYKIIKQKWHVTFSYKFFILTTILASIAFISATFFDDLFAIKFFHYAFYCSGLIAFGLHIIKYLAVGTIKSSEGEIIWLREDPFSFFKQILISIIIFSFLFIYVVNIVSGKAEPFVLRL